MANDIPTLTAWDRLGNTLYGTFTNGVTRYEQEWQEGPSTASWRFVAGENGITERDLLYWFDNRLGNMIRADWAGARVWEGYVWEMTLLIDGVLYTQSLSDYASAVLGEYTDANGDRQYGEWQNNYEAASRYWQKELIISLSTATSTAGEDSDLNAEANERAAAWLEKVSSPYTTQVAYTTEDGAWLDVSCGGRIAVANNRWMFPWGDPPGEGHLWATSTTVGDEIQRILDDYMPNLLTPVDIAANDTPTKIGVMTKTRAWDRLLELVSLRNSDGKHYELIVEPDGAVVYRQVDTTPDYLRIPGRGIETLTGRIPTWDARPGIIRTLDTAGGPAMPDTWLPDRNLVYAERVTMGQGDAVASFGSKTITAGDYYSEMDRNARWLGAER